MKCPSCGIENADTAKKCTQCGLAFTAGETQELDPPDSLFVTQPWGTSAFSTGVTLLLHIKGGDRPISVPVPDEITIGRSDGEHKPTLDLNPYGARDQGVSRIHVTIRRIDNQLYIFDKASANGTYINGELIERGKYVLLHDGDEVRLGRLVMYLYWK